MGGPDVTRDRSGRRAVRAPRVCPGGGVTSRSLYKSCPARQIPHNFHLAGRGDSTKRVEIPCWRQLYIEPTYMVRVTALSRSLYKSCPARRIPLNFHLTGRGDSTKKVEIPWWGRAVEIPPLAWNFHAPGNARRMETPELGRICRSDLHGRCNGRLEVSLQILPSLPDST